MTYCPPLKKEYINAEVSGCSLLPTVKVATFDMNFYASPKTLTLTQGHLTVKVSDEHQFNLVRHS